MNRKEAIERIDNLIEEIKKEPEDRDVLEYTSEMSNRADEAYVERLALMEKKRNEYARIKNETL